jgi:hypothetical protein
MFRRLACGLLAAGLLLLMTAPAAIGQPPTTTTTHEKGLVETFLDVVPTCEGGGPLYTITTTSNLVEHETVFDNGNVHATFTQTGKFNAVPLNDPTLPSFTGKFTVWGNFKQSRSVVNGTFTFNLPLTQDHSRLRHLCAGYGGAAVCRAGPSWVSLSLFLQPLLRLRPSNRATADT